MPDRGVDSVAHDVHARGVQRRIRVEDVDSHAVADGDDGVGVLDGVALDPRRDPVAAAELFGLPGPSRLERVRGEDVRDAVEHGGEMTGQPGVPGVRVHDVGARGGRWPSRSSADSVVKRRVGAGERRVGLSARSRPSRGAPMQCTSTSHSRRSCATSSVT